LLGAGRHALEVSGYCVELGYEPAFYLEETHPTGRRDLAGYDAPVLSFADDLTALIELPVIGSVGAPDVRERLVTRWPGAEFATVVSARAWVAGDATLGAGSTVAPFAAINRFAAIGEHVIVNVGAQVAHDVTIGEYCTICPGVTIGGGVTVGRGVFLGIGCTIRDRVVIGDGAVVAAGAVVVADVGSGTTVQGVPARLVRA
jgi:sugar O-acyltransferase (sialic acid O-acetyltransferase NeuD family)